MLKIHHHRVIMNWGLVASFVSMTPANVKRYERNESGVVEDVFYCQVQEVKSAKKVGKYTLPEKSFVFSTVKFIFDKSFLWTIGISHISGCYGDLVTMATKVIPQ